MQTAIREGKTKKKDQKIFVEITDFVPEKKVHLLASDDGSISSL